MNTQTLSALVSTLLIGAVGLSALLENRKSPVYKYFILFCLNLLLFQATEFIHLLLDSRPAEMLNLAVASIVPIGAVKFFRVFHSTDPHSPGNVHPAMWVISGLFLAAFGYLSVFPHDRALDVCAALLLAYVIIALLLCLLETHRRKRGANSAIEKTRHNYLLLSGVVAVAAVMMAQIPQAGAVTSAIGKLLWVLYLYFLSQMLYYYRLMDLQDVLARLAIMASLALVITGVYSALLFWVDPDQSAMFFYNTLMASLVVIILLDPLKSTVEQRVHQTVFRERYELRRHLRSLRWRLSQILEVQPLFDELITGLAESRRVTQASAYISTVDGTAFALKAHLGPQPPERLDAAANRIFLGRLRMDGVLVYESLSRARDSADSGDESDGTEKQAIDAVLRVLEQLQAAACFPLMAENRMLGLFAVRDDRLRDAYSPEEVEQFRMLAEQLAVSIQNSRVYERMKERDRLAALGEMSAGLAHEIRNPLGAIKGAAQYLHDAALDGEQPNTEELEESAGEFLEIIIEEANRLNRVVSQFLDYARPDRGDRQTLAINKVIERTFQLLAQQAPPDVKLKLDTTVELPRVRGDFQQLHQVFLNLGLNAIQAMRSGGVLYITTGLRPNLWDERGNTVVVSFRDTGCGISADALKTLFIPFVTTKKKGSGLGLPISQRFVEAHGGRIEVDSKPGRGSSFRVVLPALEENEESAEKNQPEKTPPDPAHTASAPSV
jgi:signal transduction histidine kinase